MEFRILGPLEVLCDGKLLDLGGPKQRALLALLLLEANRVVSSDRLIDGLWDGEPPETAQKALQVYVSQLRRLLGKERLQTKAPGYLLQVEAGELDLQRFRALQTEARFREALQLWRGPVLSDFTYQRFAQAEIGRLEELRVACLEERIDDDLEQARHHDLIGELEALARSYPLRERLRRQLMLALYRSGRQAEALEAYQFARTALVDGLGIEPGRQLRELHQAILNQDAGLELVSDQVEAEAANVARGIFVGREPELDALRAGLDDALAGRGRLFLLVGEPGIGKSRLADELIGKARARGARVLVGRCWEAGGAPAYWPWVQSMRAYVHKTEPETLRRQLGAGASDLAQLLPELRDLFDLPEPPALEPESARFRLFEAVTSFLRSAAQARPLVLVLDDLHAADEPSLLLLQFLGRQLSASRLLVVGAYRDVDPSPTDPLTEAVTELVRESVTERIVLAGLGERDVARFIQLTSGGSPRKGLVAAIHEESEGNPLFVGEIVRLLAAEGRLDGGDADRLAIPQSVRDVIARRLRRLSEECNRVLLLASVLGREFALDALARVAAVSEEEVLDTLDEAMEARVVSEVPGSSGRLRFAHVLIRDTLYERLTTARRVRLHRMVVETLEALHEAEPRANFAELAHHSIAGSDFDKGLVYAQRAGTRALELLAYEEAARLYTMALDALELADPGNETARCALLLSLGEAEIRVGDTPSAKETFLAAAAIARRLGLSAELARSAAGYAGRVVWARAGDDERLVPLLEEGLAALGDEDVVLRARLLARLAGALRDEHSRQRRDAVSLAAVELARGAENAAALDYALEGRAYAILAPDTILEVLALGTELREVSQRGDRERIVAAHMLRNLAQLITGDVRGAEADLTAAGAVAEELVQPVQLWLVTASRSMMALATGRLIEAEQLMPKALELGERSLPDGAIPHYQMQRYTLAEFQGGVEQVEPAIGHLVAAYPARPVFRCVLAHLYARLGRREMAKNALDDLAADAVSTLPFDQEWLFGMSLLAETCVSLSDTDSAAVLYGLLLPWHALNAVDPAEGFMGSVSRYLGQLATMLQRWHDGARHFEDAMEMNERMGARPWLARTQFDYARMLRARDGPGDRDRADELLGKALATYHELGMEPYAAKAALVTSTR